MAHTNPTLGATIGTAQSIPSQYLALNTPDKPTTGTDKYFDDRYQATGHVPDAYEVVDGHLQHKQPSFLIRNPWMIPAIGVGAALTGGGLLGLGPLGGLGGGGAAALGPSTAGNIAATSAAEAAPSSLAAAPSVGSSILSSAGNLLTGGKSITSPGGILNAAGRIGGALSGIEADRQAGRTAEANATQAQDRNAISAAALNLQAPNARLASSVKGDIAANAKDFSYGAPTMVGNIPVPTSTGGLRPSIFSDNTRALGALNSQEALANEAADGGKVVNLTPLPKATATDSILGTAGTIASLAGAIPYQAPKPTQPIFYTPYGSTR